MLGRKATASRIAAGIAKNTAAIQAGLHEAGLHEAGLSEAGPHEMGLQPLVPPPMSHAGPQRSAIQTERRVPPMAKSAIERYRRDGVKRATGLLTIKDYH